MCRKEVIGPAMLVIGLLYIAVSALLVLTSFGLAGNDEATTAFGGANISAAVWLLLIATLMCPLSVTGAYGARTHNKFCLFSFCTLTLVVIFTMWGVAGSLQRLSYLPVEDEEALRCLSFGLVGGKNMTTATASGGTAAGAAGNQNNGTTTTLNAAAPSPSSSSSTTNNYDDPCFVYFSNDYVSRLRDLWVTLHDRALDSTQEDSKKWNTFMNNMQKGTIAGFPCCGFSRPAHCTTDSGATCSGSLQVNPKEKYFEATQICSQGRGGCRFDKPMGICAYEELKPESSGCAHTMKRWIQGQMDATASTINLFSMIPLLGFFYSLCMTFKRKHEDVLPAEYTRPKRPPKLSEAIVSKI
jgi:hypothetical protein